MRGMPDRTREKRPADVNQRAKMIVGIATGEIGDEEDIGDKHPEAVALGRLGGKKGGRARALSLTPEQRREIAKKAAMARWGKNS